MTHIVLLAMFFTLFAGQALGFDFSLAPGLSVKNAFLYLLFVALTIETAVTRGRNLELLPVLIPFILYSGYATFSWLVVILILDYPSYSRMASLVSLKAGPIEDLVVLLVFFYGVLDARRSLWLLRSMVWLVIVGNVLTVFDGLGFIDIGFGRRDEEGRFGGPIGGVNQFGGFLAFMVPFIIAACHVEKGVLKWLAAIGLLFSCLAFVMAMSRAAFVGLAAGGIIGAYYLRAAIAPRTIFRAGVATVVVCLVVLPLSYLMGFAEPLIERVAQMRGPAFQATSGRSMIWGMALQQMLNNPVTFVTGFGWYAYDTFSPSGFSAHNHYLHLLYNLGLIGVGLFLLIVANVLGVARSGLQRMTPEAKPWLIAFVFGFLALLVYVFFGSFGPTPWLYIWAFAGIALRVAATGAVDPAVIARPMPEVPRAIPVGHAVRAGPIRAQSGEGTP